MAVQGTSEIVFWTPYILGALLVRSWGQGVEVGCTEGGGGWGRGEGSWLLDYSKFMGAKMFCRDIKGVFVTF